MWASVYVTWLVVGVLNPAEEGRFGLQRITYRPLRDGEGIRGRGLISTQFFKYRDTLYIVNIILLFNYHNYDILYLSSILIAYDYGLIATYGFTCLVISL